MAIAFLFVVVNTVSAVATLENGFLSRGMYSDLKYTMYDQGGTNRAYYRIYTSNDLFSDSAQVGDFVFVSMCAPFSGWEVVNLDTVIGAVDYTLVYEYWNGTSWGNFTNFVDGTNNLSQNGQITWTQPTDWETWRYDSNTASKSGAYAQYLLKIRITSLDTWTEGGHLTGYQKVRQKYIYLNDGGSHTPASLYADDIANGWGVITKKGDYAYDISCGMYFRTATFTFNSAKIQIGDAGSPNYVPFRVYGCTMICNDHATYLSDDLASALIVYSKGSEGTIAFYPNVNSKLYNLYLAQPYDTHYSRFAVYTIGGGSGTLCQWYNVMIGSMMYTGGSHNFVRMNFQNIQYLLSAGDTVYDNCIFGTRFNKDPSYAPVVLRPTFDGGSTAAGDWMGMYYPDSATRQHHMDVVSGSWTKGNKWKCYCDDAYPTSTQRSHIQIYSQFLNADTFDKDGNPLFGVSLKLKNETGFSVLWEDLDVYFTSSPSNTLDASLIVDDASTLNAGDKILWWGEIMNITNIAGNTLTVERGLYGSARGFNFNDRYVPLRRQVESMTIDESKDEIYVLERVYYRYSLDGGITTTGNCYKDYGATTVTASKPGYETYTANFEIRDELDLSITMTPGLSDDCGMVEVYGTEYTSGEPGTIYAQLLYVDGSPANNKDITVNVWERMNKYIDNQAMTYITGSNGCYLYNFTTPSIVSVFMVDVNCSDPIAYGSGEFHISQWAQDISDINDTVNSINNTITSTIIDYLDDINNTINSNANLLANIDSDTTNILAKWGSQTAQALYNLEWETRNISNYVNGTIWGNFTELVDKWGIYTASSLYSVSNQAKNIVQYVNDTRWNTYVAATLYSKSNSIENIANYINNTRWNTKNAQDLYDISDEIKTIAEYISDTVDYINNTLVTKWAGYTVEDLYSIINYINATRWDTFTAQQLYNKADEIYDITEYINTSRWGLYSSSSLYLLSEEIKDIADYINTSRWSAYNASILYNMLDTIDNTVTRTDETVTYINDTETPSGGGFFRVLLSNFGEINPGSDYKAQLLVFNETGCMIDADALPLINLYDSNGNAVVTGAQMTKVLTGRYSYSYTTSSGQPSGQWMTISSTVIDGNTVENVVYWELESNPPEVKLTVTDTTITTIQAELSITNEGTSPQEYTYYYWITPRVDGDIADWDTIDVASASKLINPSDTYVTSVSLSLSSVGDYYYKARVYYGTEYSSALQKFTSTKETPGGGGGGGRGGGPSSVVVSFLINTPTAMLVIKDQSNNEIFSDTIVSGSYVRLPTGTYTFTFTANNYKTITITKTITSNDVIEANLQKQLNIFLYLFIAGIIMSIVATYFVLKKYYVLT